MKRNSLLVIMVLIAAVFSVSLSACGNQTGKETNAAEAETTVEETNEEIEEETKEEIVEESEEETDEEIKEEPEEETNEEIEEETEEEIEEETEAEIEEETPKEIADYTVEDIEAKTMYASTSLNVRTGPSTEYSKAGSLSVKEAVTVTGVADTGWYRLDYNGVEAYVSNKYLQDTQVAVTVASTSTQSTDTTSTASTASMDGWVYGGLDQLIDGEWMAIYWNDDTGEMKYVSTGRYADIGNSVQESQFMESMAREAFDIVNQYRADVGLDALTWNDAIYEGTKIRAQELVASYSHTRPNGERCSTVISDFSYVGENIARGQGSASHVCNSWYNSEGHRNNMLNENYTKGAIACWYENGTYYWVNLFSM